MAYAKQAPRQEDDPRFDEQHQAGQDDPHFGRVCLKELIESIHEAHLRAPDILVICRLSDKYGSGLNVYETTAYCHPQQAQVARVPGSLRRPAVGTGIT